MSINAIRKTLGRLRTYLDVIDNKRFVDGMMEPDEHWRFAACELEEILSDNNCPFKFKEGILGFLKTRNDLQHLSIEELTLLAEKHLTVARTYLKKAKEASALLVLYQNF